MLGLKLMWKQQEWMLVYLVLGGMKLSKFKGGHFIFVISSSVCVALFIVEDLAA